MLFGVKLEKRAGERSVVTGFIRQRFATGYFRKFGMSHQKRRHAIGIFFRLVGTCGIDKFSAWGHRRGGGRKNFILQGHQRFEAILRPTPARIRAAAQYARIGARGVDEHAVKSTARGGWHSSAIAGFHPIKMKAGKIFTKAAQPGRIYLLGDKARWPCP